MCFTQMQILFVQMSQLRLIFLLRIQVKDSRNNFCSLLTTNKKKNFNVTVHASTNKRPNAINQSGKTTQINIGENMKTDLKEFFSYKIKEANVSWI